MVSGSHQAKYLSQHFTLALLSQFVQLVKSVILFHPRETTLNVRRQLPPVLVQVAEDKTGSAVGGVELAELGDAGGLAVGREFAMSLLDCRG